SCQRRMSAASSLPMMMRASDPPMNDRRRLRNSILVALVSLMTLAGASAMTQNLLPHTLIILLIVSYIKDISKAKIGPSRRLWRFRSPLGGELAPLAWDLWCRHGHLRDQPRRTGGYTRLPPENSAPGPSEKQSHPDWVDDLD